jgi:hypothetical protein
VGNNKVINNSFSNNNLLNSFLNKNKANANITDSLSHNKQNSEIGNIKVDTSLSQDVNAFDKKIEYEVKEARKQKELNLVNKVLSNNPKEIKNNFQLTIREQLNSLTFPLISKISLGVNKSKLSIPQIKEVLMSNFPDEKENFLILQKFEKNYYIEDVIELTLPIVEREDKITSITNNNNINNSSVPPLFIIGYISKEISEILHESLKFEILNHLYILDKSTLDLYVIISFNLNSDKSQNITCEYESDFFYRLKSTYTIPIECAKILNKFSMLNKIIKSNDLCEEIYYFLNFQIYPRKNLKNKGEENFSEEEKLESLETLENEENSNNNNFNQFILSNIENILSMAKHYNFLFDFSELKCFDNYFKDLTEQDKEIFLKFLTRSSLWINKKKLCNQKFTEDFVNSTIEKLLSVNLLSKVDIIFASLEGKSNYYLKSDLFSYLYYLSNDDLKLISKELSKLCKYNQKLEDNEKVVEEIFMNNSFYGLDKYMDFENLKKLSEISSKEISTHNFISKNASSDNNKNKFFNFGLNYSNNSTGPRIKYISNFLNYTNFKKVKISKINFSQKMLTICGIIKNIDYYLNDKSSSMMQSFLMIGATKKNTHSKLPINDKKQKLINLLSQFEVYTLNSKFAKLFDCASRLFFFYSDYKDINDVAREFYGFENFEKFDNYVSFSAKEINCSLSNINTSQLIEKEDKTQLNETSLIETEENSILITFSDKSHLKPIFTIMKDFKLYDNLYQIKTSFLINCMIFNSNNLNFFIAKTFCVYLMYLNNKELFKLIYEQEINFELLNTEIISLNNNLHEIESENSKFFTLNSELDKILQSFSSNTSTSNLFHEKLLQILFNTNFHYVEKNFLSKYKYQHIAAELLNYFAECCEKVKNFSLAALIFLFLLLNPFLSKKRGLWWYRLILIYNKYLKDKVTCVKLLNKASTDPYVKSGFLVKLKQYYERFEKEKLKEKEKISKKNQKTKKTSKETNPSKSKDYLDSLESSSNLLSEKDEYDEKYFMDKKRVIQADSVLNKMTGRRLYSLGSGLSTVEEFAIDYYKKLGYTGIHGENTILPALYNIFLWDIIFYDKVPYVFQSHYQIYPLDFFSEDFYNNRKSLIDRRLEQIASFNTIDIQNTFDFIYTKKKNIKCVFINWNYALCDREILMKIAIAITPRKLASLFLEFTKNLKFMIKGMPDLFLWKESIVYETNSKSVLAVEDSALLVEVKSKNDKLSDHQKYWLSFLTKIEQNVEILHIE